MADTFAQERGQYFNAVYARSGDAPKIACRAVRFADGSSPVANQCHENADRWVRENSEYSAVRGWLVDSEMLDFVLLIAHSVVEGPNGEMFDITLASDHRRFIVHEGPSELFDRLKTADSNVWWSPLAAQESEAWS